MVQDSAPSAVRAEIATNLMFFLRSQRTRSSGVCGGPQRRENGSAAAGEIRALPARDRTADESAAQSSGGRLPSGLRAIDLAELPLVLMPPTPPQLRPSQHVVSLPLAFELVTLGL